MADWSYQLRGRSSSKGTSWFSRIFLCLFATPFAAFGLFAIWSGIQQRHETGAHNGVFIALFGLVFAAIGFGLMYVAITAGRRQRQAEEKWNAQTAGGSKVWLARPDWAAGKIKSSAGAQQKIFLLMGVAFLGIGGVSTAVALPQELPKGNYLVLLVLLFPVVGLGLLATAVRGILAQRRVGLCTLELAQTPVPLGGTLDGVIQTEHSLRLEQGLHLKISCINRTVSGSGDDRSVQENILWQDEKVFRANTALPGAGGSAIPVHFDLPADQPEASLRGDATVVWRLEARAKQVGPDFAAVFEVPVFRVAGFVPPPRKQADPTAPMQMSAEEIRRDAHSKIQVNQVPGGREFYFPPARNIGVAVVTTVFLLVFSSVAFFTYRAHAPIIFPIAFGLVGVLLIYGTCSLWFKSSRITIDSTGVTILNRWLIFSRTRRIDAGEIVRFATKVGMTSGTQTFQDIKLITRASEDNFAARKARFQQTGERPPLKFGISSPGGITLASSIASTPEANWLVAEMHHALGRPNEQN